MLKKKSFETLKTIPPHLSTSNMQKRRGEIKTIAFNNFQSHTRNVLNVIIGVGFSSYYTGSLFINADISLKSAVVICMRKWVLE